MSRKYQITKNSNFWTSAGASPSSGARLGAGVSLRLLPPLRRFKSRARLSNSARTSILTPTLALAIAVLGISLFSQTAYAASYINVSSGSGGTVSLGSIKPSATGVSASGSDTLTITTNCSAGYSVYVSAQNGGDTNLTNTNSSVTSNNTISASGTAVGSTAMALSSNTWGITGDASSASASKYVGLPSYADATNTALISNSSASTTGDNKSTVYYGVKVDTTLSPGTYSGDVLYTTLVSDKCNNYTVHFNANGGTGEMSDQTIPVGTATNLTANAFSRSGYAFLGWSTDKNATGQTYLDGQSVKDITDFNSTITLYAVWAASSGTMQSWTGCPSLAASQSVFLTDSRDNKVYAVKNLPDGKCWMMQNLTIGMDGAKTLTPENTNIDDGKTYYLPPAGKQGSSTIDDSSTLTATDTANFTSDAATDKHAKTQFRSKNPGITNDSDTGYYNFYTATLGFSYYGDGVTSGSSARDICPKGWRLPKTTDSGTNVTTAGSANDFTYLALQYNSSTGWNGTATGTNGSGYYNNNDVVRNPMYKSVASPLATSTQNNYAGFSRSGYWHGANSDTGDVGTSGNYWASSIYSDPAGYRLAVYGSSVYPNDRNGKNYGYAVRCVAQNNYTISYSNSGADSGEASKTSESAYESGSVTMPTVGTMTKDGYEFKGWALTSGASDATYIAEQTVTISALISAASSAGQATTPGSTITLYPVWESSAPPDDGNLGTMQDFICNNLTPGHTATLTDSRDNQTYTVYRIPTDQTYKDSATVANIAGKCIMTQDLSLGYVTGGSITKGSDLALTTSDSAAAGTITARTGTSDWSGTDNNDNLQYINGPRDDYETYSSHSYYSFGAAQKVCPKNWRLPTGGEYGTYSNTAQTTGLAAIVGNDADGSKALRASPWSFIFGGRVTQTGWGSQNAYGEYWASTQYGSTDGFYLNFNSSSAYRGSDVKNRGRSVRCIADPYEEAGTMQTKLLTTIPTGKTVVLTDSRDGQKYTIYRWPTSGTAGTDYPTDMAGYAIMTQDLSLGYVTGGLITKGSDLTLTTTDSAAAGTITARTGTSDWSAINSDDNLQYINGTGGTYDSHSYYSYGAAQKVCPKGWRLPTNTEYNNIATFMGGGNSAGSSKIRGTPYNFVYSGCFYPDGWRDVGSLGRYWSSTQNGIYGYALDFNSSNLGTFSNFKYNGASVRCIKTSYEGYK